MLRATTYLKAQLAYARQVRAARGRLKFTHCLHNVVNGVTVVKNIERMLFARNTIAGPYYGGLIGTTSNCVPANLNGA